MSTSTLTHGIFGYTLTVSATTEAEASAEIAEIMAKHPDANFGPVHAAKRGAVFVAHGHGLIVETAT